ncbi:MAG: PHP domain-containing protein [Vallitaleaceae bacterium]|jgi:predicted metal-dependent phosphoesterase TrpH|nr:PHP domain-containing protein [Vallitaleaceae bacterium]
MRKVDLHIHSYASDGEWSPEDVIRHVDENDIKIFAVCDHDTTGCVPFLDELTNNRDDLTFIKGVEVSSTYKGRELHILTYNIDETSTELQAILKANIDIREAYNTEIVAYLSKKHNQISVDDYKGYVYNPYQGGWRTYGYFIDRGLITGLSDYWFMTKGF